MSPDAFHSYFSVRLSGLGSDPLLESLACAWLFDGTFCLLTYLNVDFSQTCSSSSLVFLQNSFKVLKPGLVEFDLDGCRMAHDLSSCTY